MLIDEFCSKTGLRRSDLAKAFGCPRSTFGYYSANSGQIALVAGEWHLMNKSSEITYSCSNNDLPGPHRVM